jgi:hypothetical protein
VAQHPRRQTSSYSPLWEPEISPRGNWLMSRDPTFPDSVQPQVVSRYLWTSAVRSSYQPADIPAKPTIWRSHMSTCDHHDNACTVWFVTTIIYLMSCTTRRLFRQVSCPSAKWRTLPANDTHPLLCFCLHRPVYSGGTSNCSRLRLAALYGTSGTLFYQPTWNSSLAMFFVSDRPIPNLIKIHCVVV